MNSKEIRAAIANKFLEALQQNVIPWRKPWARTGRKPFTGQHNFVTGRPYSGVNPMFLGFTAHVKGWSDGWATFNQIKKAGGSVRKGEKGSMVVFWKFLDVEEENPTTGLKEKKRIPMLRSFTVFNRDQCEGLPAVVKPQEEDPTEFEIVDAADAIVAGMPNAPAINHDGGDRAFYHPAFDRISMPTPECFNSPAEYYSTLFHEMAHSTGHESRLDRSTLTKMVAFGDVEYAREELVAEMTSAFLCHDAGISDAVIENQTAYVQNWAKRIKNDPDMVLWAAGQASKAADYINPVEASEDVDGDEA